MLLEKLNQHSKSLILISIVFTLLFLPACMPYKRSTASYLNENSPAHKQEALQSPIYDWVPRKAEQIYFFDLPHWLAWAFLGNEDDGIFGEETKLYLKEEADFEHFTYWSVIRNPLHNFTFYIIFLAC